MTEHYRPRQRGGPYARPYDHAAPYSASRVDGRILALAVGAGLGLVGAALWRAHATPPRHRMADDAPGRTARQARFGDYAVTGRSVTINRPREEVYAFWRDFSNLPRFMTNIERVEVAGDISTWVIAAPAGRRVEVRSRLVADRPNEEIAWRSIEGSDIDTEGKVMFRDAPAGRGTIVEAVIAYVPPAGELGRLIARAFRREPGIQGRHELKRLKMLLETGEISTSHNRRSA